MTEKLLTGTLSLNTNKQTNKDSDQPAHVQSDQHVCSSSPKQYILDGLDGGSSKSVVNKILGN